MNQDTQGSKQPPKNENRPTPVTPSHPGHPKNKPGRGTQPLPPEGNGGKAAKPYHQPTRVGGDFSSFNCFA